MGSGCSTFSFSNQILFINLPSTLTIRHKFNSFNNHPTFPIHSHFSNLNSIFISQSPPSLPLKSSKIDSFETQQQMSQEPIFNPHDINPILLQNLTNDALVWSSLHGLVVGDRAVQVCPNFFAWLFQISVLIWVSF